MQREAWGISALSKSTYWYILGKQILPREEVLETLKSFLGKREFNACEIQFNALVKKANLYMPFKEINKEHKINNCYYTMTQTPTHLYRLSWSFHPKEDLEKAKKEQKGQ